MFFASTAVALALGVTAFFVHERESTMLTRGLVWLSLANLVTMAGINLLYAMETWWN